MQSEGRSFESGEPKPRRAAPFAEIDLRDREQANQCVRDLVALSTLPAVWLGADVLRIAENLAASLYTTVGPEFVYVSLREDADLPPVSVAQTDRCETNAELAEKLGTLTHDWARTHDPDDFLSFPNPAGPGSIRIAVRPLGSDAEFGVLAAGFLEEGAPTTLQQLLLNVGAVQGTTAVQNARLLRSLRSNISEREAACLQAHQARVEAETLNEVSRTFAYTHDLQRILQIATDAATKLTGGRFGAFFYNVANEDGESYMLYTLSGAPREAFDKLDMPRNTALFDETFRGKGIVRCDDVLQDPRYGKTPPHYGLPRGHLPVRSYLAVPVISRSGEVLGGLFFGHPEPGMFSVHAERMAMGVAAQAAIAIDNARLLEQQQRNAERIRHQLAISTAVNNSLGEGLLTLDQAGRVTFANPAAAEMLGWDQAALHGKEISQVLPNWRLGHAPDGPNLLSMLATMRTVRSGEDLFLRRNGASFSVLWTASPILLDGQISGATIVFHDISERKRSEEALREQLELNATLTSNSTQALFMMDGQGYCTFMNAVAEKMFGFTSEEIQARPLHELIHHHHPDGRLYPRQECPIDRALPENFDIREHEDVFIRKNGEFFPVLVAASPIFKDGKPVSTIIEVRDITERKRAEQALREAQARLAEHAVNLENMVAERTAKLRETVNELQTLSYSIAHDMRAPLRAMAAFAELLLDEISTSGLSSEANDYCRRILTGASRLDRLIKDALNYTKLVLKELPLQPVELSKLLRDLIDTYPNLHPQKADICIESNLPVVLGNESLLTQCFSNLLGNAVKFVAPGTRPQVRIRAETIGSYSRIWIQDNGIGISRHAQERLFGLFQKLDNEYEGTGIGLAIVRKVAQRMGAKVGVESEPGCGSRFWVELPLAAPGAAPGTTPAMI